MVRKPELESVIVLVISVLAIGLTVAALLLPEKGLAERAAAPAARAVVPVSPASRPAAPGLAAGAPGSRVCTLSPLRHHDVRRPSHRRVKPSRESGVAAVEAPGGDEGSFAAPPPAGGAAAPCSEKVRPEAARPARCLLDR
jgi:hypothetical protein